MHIDIEKNYSSISGGVCGSDKNGKNLTAYTKTYTDIMGCPHRDIMEKRKGYEDVVHTLSM